MPRRSWNVFEPGMNPRKLEAILRYYPEFYALYEATGQDEITLDDGIVVNIHDVTRGIRELPRRQMQAVVLTCLYGLREVDVARLMGLTGQYSSTVGLYKKKGLEKLIARHWSENGIPQTNNHPTPESERSRAKSRPQRPPGGTAQAQGMG